MRKRIIVFPKDDLLYYPPTISLLKTLVAQGYTVECIGEYSDPQGKKSLETIEGADKFIKEFYEQQNKTGGGTTAVDFNSWIGTQKKEAGKDTDKLAALNKASAIFNTAARGTEASGKGQTTDLLNSLSRIVQNFSELIGYVRDISSGLGFVKKNEQPAVPGEKK